MKIMNLTEIRKNSIQEVIYLINYLFLRKIKIIKIYT